jgi:alkanesulfonate monooxygenase SsuD/methylene tetrahydromethanopterin reductase-like flavin-dependent oxidoreductase (luciferase family)
MSRQMKLGAFLMPTGHHIAAWRHPDAAADAGIDFDHMVRLAQTAERGLFDMVFFEDAAGVREARVELAAQTPAPTTSPMRWRELSPRSTS